MSWLIWRQHRGELLGAVVVLALLGVLLVLHGIPMHRAYDRDGVEACQLLMFSGTEGGFGQACGDTVTAFDDEFATLPNLATTWLPFLPMLAGMLIGAPLLAREYEQGTWQLAWTQGVTRTRWLASKLALVFGGLLAVSVVFAAAMSWWLGPLTPHRFTQEKFNHAVLVFPGYVMLGVAIGVLAGVALRRTLVAAAITVGAYLAVRIPLEFLLRPHYREPVETNDPAVAERGWVVHDAEYGAPVGGSPVETANPLRYHPADRFWEFQLIETAILAAITIVLLVIAWRLVLGRKASAPAAPDQPALVGSP